MESEDQGTHQSSSFSSWMWRWVNLLIRILLHPVCYFRESREEILAMGGTSPIVAFSLVLNWIVTAASVFFINVMNGKFQHQGPFRTYATWLQSAEGTIYQAGYVLLYPFVYLSLLVIGTGLVYGAARIFLPENSSMPKTFRTLLNIRALASLGGVCMLVPLVGGFLSALWIDVIAVIGIREIYRTSISRAIVVAMICEICVLALAIALFLFFVFSAVLAMRCA